MSSTSVYAAIAVVLALCVAGAIAAIVAAGPVTETRNVPRLWELPGGFDPLPEFDTASRELEFRGAACRGVTEQPYVLVRECSSEAPQP